MVSDTVLSYMWCQYEIHGFKGLSEGVKQPASVASEQIWKCDEHVQCETPKKLFYPPTILGEHVDLHVFVSAFMKVSTVWSVFCL